MNVLLPSLELLSRLQQVYEQGRLQYVSATFDWATDQLALSIQGSGPRQVIVRYQVVEFGHGNWNLTAGELKPMTEQDAIYSRSKYLTDALYFKLLKGVPQAELRCSHAITLMQALAPNFTPILDVFAVRMINAPESYLNDIVAYGLIFKTARYSWDVIRTSTSIGNRKKMALSYCLQFLLSMYISINSMHTSLQDRSEDNVRLDVMPQPQYLEYRLADRVIVPVPPIMLDDHKAFRLTHIDMGICEVSSLVDLSQRLKHVQHLIYHTNMSNSVDYSYGRTAQLDPADDEYMTSWSKFRVFDWFYGSVRRLLQHLQSMFEFQTEHYDENGVVTYKSQAFPGLVQLNYQYRQQWHAMNDEKISLSDSDKTYLKSLNPRNFYGNDTMSVDELERFIQGAKLPIASEQFRRAQAFLLSKVPVSGSLHRHLLYQVVMTLINDVRDTSMETPGSTQQYEAILQPLYHYVKHSGF
jgi:hypothetical protein